MSNMSISAQHSPAARAIWLQGRRATYRLLARLYLAPLDTELVASLRALPGFAEHLPAQVDESDGLDELAVEYEGLFGRNVYPYESIYRDRDLMLNTAAADRFAALYKVCGLGSSGISSCAPDHLGLELHLMSELCALEERANAKGEHAAIQSAQTYQARCLHEHLAHWAPICAHTIARVTTQPLYATLAVLTTELVLTDLAVLPWHNLPPLIPLEERWHRTDMGDDDDPAMSTIVQQLLTPDLVGVFLCRADISRLGRVLQLPVPMGDRFQMLRGLFEAAGQFDRVWPLLDTLARIFTQADSAVVTLIQDYPAWALYGAAWQKRIADGRALLAQLRAQLDG